MGGRGGASDMSSKKGSDSIEQKIENLNAKIKSLQDESIRVLNNREHSYDPTPQRYYDIAKEVRGLMSERSELMNKKAEVSRKNQPKTPRKFVNSYGEATTREITSATYKRAQRRLERDIERRMGRK